MFCHYDYLNIILIYRLAESGGFEPPEACTSSLFESDTLDHSDNSPYIN